MSSPVAKLNRFSRLFSSASVNLSQNAKTLITPKLDSTPGLPILPDDYVRLVETPSTNRSPTLCSTPAVDHTDHAFGNDTPQSRAGSTDAGKGSSLKSSWKVPATLRNRCLGVSDGMPLAKSKNYRKHRRCNVFSTSVVPVVKSKKEKMQVVRLSGLALSPSSVSWTNQSPFPPQNERNSSTSSYFFYQSVEQGSDAEAPGGLQVDLVEQCPPEKLYHWEEYEDEIVPQESIGAGGFSQVFKGTYRGEKVAIKKLQKVYKSRPVFVETFQGEINGLRLRHPNIVRTLVIIQASPHSASKAHHSSCYVVMEHAGNRNLSQIINIAEEDIDEERRFRYCTDILTGLSYLHRNKLAHLDLKPSNVMVTSSDQCKLCDFGSCTQVTSPNKSAIETAQAFTSSCDSAIGSSFISARLTSTSSSSKSGSHLMGTFIYRAPELLRGLQPNLKSDVFSFGITAWQLWSRLLPYAGQHYHTAVYGVVALGLRPPVPDKDSESFCSNLEEKYFDLVTSCWQADPVKRPTAEKALMMLKS